MGQIAPEPDTTITPHDPFTRAWDTITLARFLRQLPDDVRVHHDAGDRPLRWVEPSDIDDPTPYLVDHELILTSGSLFVEHAEDQQWVDSFVARLVEAKVSALGFAMDPYFFEVPTSVIDACRRHDLTLWEIPASLPFAAIGLAFAKLMEADSARQLRHSAEANRALMRCVAAANPEEQLVTVLAQRAGCAVQLLSPAGRLRHYASGSKGTGLDGAALAKLCAEAVDAPAAGQLVMEQDESGTHLAFPIRAGTSGTRSAAVLGVLQLSFAQTPTSIDHALASTALGLLEVVARQRMAGSFAPTQLATTMLLTGRANLDARELELFAGSLGGPARRPVRVVALRQQGDPGESGLGADVTPLRSLLDTKLVLAEDAGFLAITRAEPVKALFDRLKRAGYVAAFSHPAEVNPKLAGQLADLTAQARGLLGRAREEGRCLDAAELPRTFASLLPQQAGRQLAEETLAGVLELPAKRRRLYLQVLRAWLAANGSWDVTAGAIDLHRNSVRRHIASIGELLDLDLSEAAVRIELYLALSFLPEQD
ncbi:PucR family transcriptional regulator [Glutamicibacter endophyticus]|uniref:PucR family transcriptional regulator n=1 Tax=Glutamicibacter endophyticus TaxID=1522174 RepID=UPI003AF0DF71